MHREKQKLVRVGLMVVLVLSLGALTLVIFGDRPAEAYNIRTISQLQQYMNALELVYADEGMYPGPDEFTCLGDYSDDTCWNKGGTGKMESTDLNTALVRYIPLLSSGRMVESKSDPSQNYEGYIYRQLNNGKGYEIQYFLSGKKKDCGFGNIITSSVEGSTHNENTWCHIIR